MLTRHMLRMTAVLVLTSVSAARAGEQVVRLPWDQLAEADLVVAAVAGSSMPVTLLGAPDDRRYLAVVSLTVSRVIKGSGASPGGMVDVALTLRPTAAQVAVTTPVPADSDPAVWFLRRVPDYFTVDFATLMVIHPDPSLDFDTYLASYQDAAAAMQSYAPIHMELVLPSTIQRGGPIDGTVRLFTGPSDSGMFPAPMSWSEHVAVLLERDDDPAVMVQDESPLGVGPYLEVQSITGMDGDTIPATFPPDTSVQAAVTVLPSQVRFDGSQAVFFAYARLFDDQTKTLIQSAPVTVTITQP